LKQTDVTTFTDEPFEHWRLSGTEPYYETRLGVAYLGDSLELLKLLPPESVDLIMTSPPFALTRKKEYGNVEPEEYVLWFKSFALEFWRVLSPNGSFVLHIGGSWNKGEPTKSLYTYELLLALTKEYEKRFYLAQDFYWYNTAKLPAPAEWVTVRRIRAKDSVEFLWWFSKDPFTEADNRRVLRIYSESMKRLLKNGYKAKLRPSGHKISKKFKRDLGGSIPANLLVCANTDSGSRYFRKCRERHIKPNPARYPQDLPEFFIKLITNPYDKILDPFAGSNTTGFVAEELGRRWMSFEIFEDYLKGSVFRFSEEQILRSRFQ